MKKESYFTDNTIRLDAERLRSQTTSSRVRTVNPVGAKTALLILDMQRYFLDPGSHAFIPSAPAIIPGIRALKSHIEKKVGIVLITRHVNTDQNAGNMASWWRDVIRPDEEASEIIPEFSNSLQRAVTKTQYDPFYKTDLEQILRKAGIRQVIIAGVMTHLCCETAARSSFIRGFDVVFPVDATATYNSDLHLASLKTIGHGFATIPTISELLREDNP